MKFLRTIFIITIFTTFGFSAEYILKFSHVVNENTPKGKAADYFEKKLEELSEGRIDVKVYPSSKLYSDNDAIKALKNNSIQMAAPSFAKLSKTVPQLGLFDLPFLFEDMNHLHKVLDGKIGEKLFNLVNEKQKDYMAISFWDNHFKQLTTSSKKPLIMPDDIKGQKFRVMSSDVLVEQFKVLNAKSKNLSFSKVFEELEKGLIDGQENTISNIYSNKLYKVQKHLTLTNHGYLGYLVVISRKFWKSLPWELKRNVMQAMAEATEKERFWAKELNNKKLDKIKRYAKNTKKIQIHTLNSKQIKAWQKSVKPIYSKFYSNKKIGKSLIQGVLELK